MQVSDAHEDHQAAREKNGNIQSAIFLFIVFVTCDHHLQKFGPSLRENSLLLFDRFPSPSFLSFLRGNQRLSDFTDENRVLHKDFGK